MILPLFIVICSLVDNTLAERYLSDAQFGGIIFGCIFGTMLICTLVFGLLWLFVKSKNKPKYKDDHRLQEVNHDPESSPYKSVYTNSRKIQLPNLQRSLSTDDMWLKSDNIVTQKPIKSSDSWKKSIPERRPQELAFVIDINPLPDEAPDDDQEVIEIPSSSKTSPDVIAMATEEKHDQFKYDSPVTQSPESVRAATPNLIADVTLNVELDQMPEEDSIIVGVEEAEVLHEPIRKTIVMPSAVTVVPQVTPTQRHPYSELSKEDSMEVLRLSYQDDELNKEAVVDSVATIQVAEPPSEISTLVLRNDNLDDNNHVFESTKRNKLDRNPELEREEPIPGRARYTKLSSRTPLDPEIAKPIVQRTLSNDLVISSAKIRLSQSNSSEMDQENIEFYKNQRSKLKETPPQSIWFRKYASGSDIAHNDDTPTGGYYDQNPTFSHQPISRQHLAGNNHDNIRKRDSGYGTMPMPPEEDPFEKEQFEKLKYFQEQLSRQHEELAKLGITVPSTKLSEGGLGESQSEPKNSVDNF